MMKVPFYLFVIWSHMFSWNVFWESKAERERAEGLCTILPCIEKKGLMSGKASELGTFYCS